MRMLDVNVLVYAFREDMQDHAEFRKWLEDLIEDAEPYAIPELVTAAFLRIVTNRRVFKKPTPFDEAAAFADVVRGQPNAVVPTPGPRHWDTFVGLCRRARVVGSMISDAYFAALAIESGSEWITTDRDYARFPGLRWRHPLEGT